MKRRSRKRTRLVLAALALIILVPGVGGASCKLLLDCGTGSSGKKVLPLLRLERPGLVHEAVASGFTAPSAFAFLPDGRILVAQVDGLVRMVKEGKVLSAPFLDLRGRVTTSKQRGFVGLEPDPDFARNGHVFVMYADENLTRVTRFTARGDRAVAGSERVILGKDSRGSCDRLPVTADCITTNGIHGGGGLDFASDGTLFVGVGDGQIGNPGEYEPDAQRAQSLDALGGKLLRVTREGKGLPSNPFWTGDPDDNRSKEWAYCLRNPFRVADRPGSLVPYVGDVGWDEWEEVDVARRGVNLGWPCYEGRDRPTRYRDTPLCEAIYAEPTGRPVQFPLVEFSHDDASSLTGGDFRGRDEYVYGDYGKWWLRTLRVDSANRVVPETDSPLATGTRAPTQIRIGPENDIYYLSISGALNRIRPAKR